MKDLIEALRIAVGEGWITDAEAKQYTKLAIEDFFIEITPHEDSTN